MSDPLLTVQDVAHVSRRYFPHFDIVKKNNLDRLNYATGGDVGRVKVELLAEFLRERATASRFRVKPVVAAELLSITRGS